MKVSKKLENKFWEKPKIKKLMDRYQKESLFSDKARQIEIIINKEWVVYKDKRGIK